MIKAKWEKNREVFNEELKNKVKETGEQLVGSKVFDDKTNKLDFRNLKGTDLKNNKRV